MLMSIKMKLIRAGWKLKKELDIGPSLQNLNKKELVMFVASDTNISPRY